MSTLFLGNFVQFFDDDGNPLSGGTVTFYEPGTSTKKDVYTASDLSTPAGNPVTLDSAGRATIFLNGDYKARLEKSDGSLVDETDNINPPVDTETSGGNLIANGSFETAGNAATDASGWTLTAQSDGTVERVTTDNYDGEACLKFTSDGSGGGQADTDAFFAVSPGRAYEVSFALKCSVADIRNIVQIRYFDADQSFLSNSTIYDEDTSNPTSWGVKQFSETPPANARFAKLRILGADQSDSTAGEAKFDSTAIRTKVVSGSASSLFPNVDDDVTATAQDLDSGWNLIETVGPLNGEPYDFTASAISEYDILQLVFNGTVYLGADFDPLFMQFSGDGGATYVSSNDYRYSYSTLDQGSSTLSADGNASESNIRLIPTTGDTEDSGDNEVVGTVQIYKTPTLTNFTTCSWDIVAIHSSSKTKIQGSGSLVASISLDAIRITTTNDNFSEGTISLYGLS